MNWLKKLVIKTNTDTLLRDAATPEAIQHAYDARFEEIESLRKYDRGEKTINPVDLKDVVRGL